MSTATLKRELALLRSSLAALTPSQSTTLDDPVAWAERIAGLTLDPWQRDVLLSLSPRLLLNATRQSGKSTVAALKAAWTVLQGGLAVVVSPSLRQSGFLFRKLARHLVASDTAFRRETLTEVELVSGGLAVSLPGDRPAMLRGLSLRHDGPAVLLVDEASRVYRQEYFGAFVSAPGSVFDAEVLAHMFGDHGKEEPDEPTAIVERRIVDRILQ